MNLLDTMLRNQRIVTETQRQLPAPEPQRIRTLSDTLGDERTELMERIRKRESEVSRLTAEIADLQLDLRAVQAALDVYDREAPLLPENFFDADYEMSTVRPEPYVE